MNNSLSVVHPELIVEWSKKNEIKPTEVTVGSHKKVIWKCRLGHEWTASVKSRSINGSGCPYCSHNKVLVGFNDLATVVPKVADLNEQAEALFSRLVKQLSEKEGVTEALKAENQMLWVQRMNNIRSAAMESVANDLMYC